MRMVVRLFSVIAAKVMNTGGLATFFAAGKTGGRENAENKVSGCYFYDYDGDRYGLRNGGVQHFHR